MPKRVDIRHIFDVNNEFGFMDDAVKRNDLRKSGLPIEYDGESYKGMVSLGDAIQIAESDLMPDYANMRVSGADVMRSAGIAAMSNAGTWTTAKLIATGVATYFGGPFAPITGSLAMIGMGALSDGMEYVSALKKAGDPNKFWNSYINNLKETREEVGVFNDITEKFYKSQSFNKAGDAAYRDAFGMDKVTGAAGLISNIVGSMSSLVAYSLVGGDTGLIGGMTLYSALNEGTATYGATSNGSAALKAGASSGAATGLSGYLFFKALPYVYERLGAKFIDGLTGSRLQPLATEFDSVTSTSLGKAAKGASGVLPPQATHMGYRMLGTYASGGVEMAGWIATEDALEKYMMGENVEVDWNMAGWMFMGGLALRALTTSPAKILERGERLARLKENRARLTEQGIVPEAKIVLDEADIIIADRARAKDIVNEAIDKGVKLNAGDGNVLYGFGKLKGKKLKNASEYVDKKVREFLANGITDPRKLKTAIWDDLGGNKDAYYQVIEKTGVLFPSLGLTNKAVSSVTPIVDTFKNASTFSDESRMMMEDIIATASKKRKVAAQFYAKNLMKETDEVAVRLGKEGIAIPDKNTILNKLHIANNMLKDKADKFSYEAKAMFVDRYMQSAVKSGFTERELRGIDKLINEKIASKKRIGVGDIESLFGGM